MKILNGEEPVTVDGNKTDFTIKDFWAWNSSDLLNNTLRGAFAEFIVAIACGLDISNARIDWEAYDLIYNDIRIEVKSAAYIQSWEQKAKSKIRFSIAPAREWSAEKWYGDEIIRHSDIYVFCLLTSESKESAHPLNMDEWEFYIIQTKKLDERCKAQKTIGMAQIKELNPIKCNYANIKNTIDNLFERK